MNQNRLLLLLLFLYLLPQQQLDAQDVKTLTMQEAVTLSVQNSKQLKLSKAKIDEAIATTREAKDNQLPDASVSASYLRLTKAKLNLKNSGGGDTASHGLAFPSVNQAIYGSANVSVPLFAGMKIKYGIESAKYLEQAVRLDAENDKQAVILNTIAAYINLYKATITKKLVEDNLEQSRKRDTDFINLEKNGLLARNDLLRAQLETSGLELNLVDAQNAIDISTVNMDLLLGLPETTILQVDTVGFMHTGEVKSIEEYEQLATQNRSDVQSLSYREKAADAAVKIAKGDYYPSVALTGGYVAADVPGVLSITNAITGGVGLKYNLASLWKTKSKIEKAEAVQQQLLVNQEMLNDNIHLSINKAYRNYTAAIKKTEVSDKAVVQANENYRISKNKYDNNLLLLTDLLDADVQALQAKLNLSAARADVVLAYYTLQQTAGLLQQ
ncbi:MAG: TolC family protein [Bacteroidetes bacterium]|nr:TolC family protein [Bacteroidota bacterium]